MASSGKYLRGPSRMSWGPELLHLQPSQSCQAEGQAWRRGQGQGWEGSGLWGWAASPPGREQCSSGEPPGGSRWVHGAHFLDDSSEEAASPHVCAGAG